MPSGLAAAVRQQMARSDLTGLVLQVSRRSKTGYTNVIEVGNMFQARLQVKGDGRGGVRKRRQYSLPGLFETPVEAAQYLALMKKIGLESLVDDEGIPFKQDKEHKPRKQLPKPAAAPAQPERMHVPMATAMATPIVYPMLHVPVAPVTPLPMQPLGYTPPFRA